jgi:hypothetical protein
MRCPEAPIISAFYQRYGAGTFSNLDRIRLRWLSLKDTPDPNYFALIPHKGAAFSFQRPNNGAVIAPRHMFTDGGSVPWLAQSLPNLSSWGYGPAYLITTFRPASCRRTVSISRPSATS